MKNLLIGFGAGVAVTSLGFMTAKVIAKKKVKVEPFDDLIFYERKDAENVLDMLKTLIKDYGVVTVMDFKDLSAVSSDYSDTEIGWTNLDKAEVVEYKKYYRIKLPNPKPVER